MARRKSKRAGGPSPADRTSDGRDRSSQTKKPAQNAKESVQDTAWTRILSERLLHTTAPDQPVWTLLPLILAVAFALRAAVAISGDFVLHPDELMQYPEQAHRLVFGNGAIYWEFFYGGRSWLVPGLIAGVLKLFDVIGLADPFWYVGAVKLMFCAISLAIPAGMYFFARHHFSEPTARIALLAGVFWYELVAFGHKPMTEFVSTATLLGLLALCTNPSIDRLSVIWKVAALAVLVTAVRVQYAPVALVLLGLVFLQTQRRSQLGIATVVSLVVIGLFDAFTWNGGLFHSYWTNVQYNLVLGETLTEESPVWQYLWWFGAASTGLAILCLMISTRWLHRYGLLLLLIVVALAVHSLQAHKEYRFTFMVIPLWLLIFSDLAVRVSQWGMQVKKANEISDSSPWRNGAFGAVATLFTGISLAGILNALPSQDEVYKSWSHETGIVKFLHSQDPIFEAYRYLAEAPDVQAVWQHDRPYHNSPGYYYLHRSIPYYDGFNGRDILTSPAAIKASVTHVVTSRPEFQTPGFSLDRSFGEVRILRRDSNEDPIRLWEEYAPVMVGGDQYKTMKAVSTDAKPPPAVKGIRFVGVKP